MLEKLRLNARICSLTRKAIKRGNQGSAITAPALEQTLSDALNMIDHRSRNSVLSSSTTSILSKFMVTYVQNTADDMTEWGMFSSPQRNQPYSKAVRMATSVLERSGYKPDKPEERLLFALCHSDWDEIRRLGVRAAEFILCDRSTSIDVALEIMQPVAADRRSRLRDALGVWFRGNAPNILECLRDMPIAQSQRWDLSPASAFNWADFCLEDVLHFLLYLDPPPTDIDLLEPRNSEIQKKVEESGDPHVQIIDVDHGQTGLGIVKVSVNPPFKDAADGRWHWSSGIEGFVYIARSSQSKYRLICCRAIYPGNVECSLYDRYPEDPRFPKIDESDFESQVHFHERCAEYNRVC